MCAEFGDWRILAPRVVAEPYIVLYSSLRYLEATPKLSKIICGAKPPKDPSSAEIDMPLGTRMWQKLKLGLTREGKLVRQLFPSILRYNKP